MILVWFGRRALAFLVAATLASAAGTGFVYRPTARELRVARKLVDLRKNPSELYAFLFKMPKGGDLHNHLGGAVYAEDLIGMAAAHNFCIDPQSWSFVPRTPPASCSSGQIDAKRALEDNDIRNHVIDAMSMRDFLPAQESAHDHFFAAFAKFQPVGRVGNPEFLAQVIRRAAEQNESYLEVMALSGGAPLSAVARRAGFSGDFEASRTQLTQAGLPAAVAELKARVDELEEKRLQLLHCPADPTSSPCRVVVRYIFQVQREFPKEQVFAQILAGFLLASEDPRVVSVNLVQPEDGVTSMADYHLHMRMLQFVRTLYPKVLLTLHAGELASGLVPPEGLRFHIREAVEIAGAERIGHAVDVNYELEPESILRTMAERRTAVEINLTSNDLILGVRGSGHPFSAYRNAGVPIVLCTDDEGVSRTHLTQEYERAALTYNLSYLELKTIVRNGLQFSFLEGSGLWKSDRYTDVAAVCASGRNSPGCLLFLSGNAKAKLQADLEDRFDQFEKQF